MKPYSIKPEEKDSPFGPNGGKPLNEVGGFDFGGKSINEVFNSVDWKSLSPNKSKKESLEDIEKRLLEIEQERPIRVHNASENYSGSWEDELEAMDITQLDVEMSFIEQEDLLQLTEKLFTELVKEIFPEFLLSLLLNLYLN